LRVGPIDRDKEYRSVEGWRGGPIDRDKEYHSVDGWGPFHTHFQV